MGVVLMLQPCTVGQSIEQRAREVEAADLASVARLVRTLWTSFQSCSRCRSTLSC